MFYKLVFLGLLLPGVLKGTDAASSKKFPDYVKFGAATASYQVEGAWNEDGKGENIWDHICHTNPDYIAKQYNGDVACDSYHRYKEDVALLKQLGADYYRFSLSWTRILPKAFAGTPVNPIAIDYYRNLTQELLDNGIEPMVTIFHWDTPEILEDIGGWPNEEIIEHYVYFARTAFEQLGDLVKLWMTFNEPKQTCLQGYGDGLKAPAITASGVADYRCAHTLIKAHARAYRLYDEKFRPEQGGTVGIVLDTEWFEPPTDSQLDREAAERTMQFEYGWYANPIVHGNYPQVMIDRIDRKSQEQGYARSRLPKFTDEEIYYIKGTFDFVALNTYSTRYAGWQNESTSNLPNYYNDLNVRFSTDDSWEMPCAWINVVPWGIRKLLNWISDTYGHPEIYVTENGYSDPGGLEDEGRINYYREYLSNVLDAILEDGVNVTRYTAWSLIDNFEWTSGYTEKLGLFSVDFDSPERTRTPKLSAAYYAKVIKTRCLVDTCE